MSMYDKVLEFRQKMELPISTTPRLLPADQVSYFSRFIMEELSEFLRANEEQSLVDASDALVDLVYVVLGMSHSMGLPFDKMFEVVHNCNMQKEPASEYFRSLRGNQYDVVKPIGWERPEPQLEMILKEASK